ncbi:MAG: acyltransferase domain-containing protein, partial [Chloroflexi bacterium]|nr:acyltransferase domain-containing protein [Chloroflexota bacterium]
MHRRLRMERRTMAQSPVVGYGTSIAVLFPGQASQEVGMGTALRRVSPAADRWFRLADELTGLPIGDLCANGPLATLTRTDVAQTAVVVTSLAAASHLEELLGGPPAVGGAAGHSVGELTAMCWAGALDPATTLRLVHARGKLMQRDAERCDGTMVAVLGLEAAELIGVCADVSTQMPGAVSVANFNAPGQ